MACNPPNEEWTINTLTDPRPTKPSETGLLVFCLKVENNKITGEVSDLSTGVEKPLSDVTGTNDSLNDVGLDVSFMTLNFTWGAAKVMMAGTTFKVGNQNQFRGRFAAFASFGATANKTSTIAPLAAAPGDGDTGTGTGTQT